MTTPCLPALPVSRSPRIPAPPLACDCHFHIFGDERVYPFGVPRDYTPPPASIQDWRKMAAQLGLGRTVVVQPSVYGHDNRCTLDAVQTFGIERSRAVVVLHDSVSDAELERMHLRGARGVRFNLVNAGGMTSDQIARVAQRVAPLGWHLQFYLEGRQLQELAPLIAALPTPAVIDHMGMIRANSPTYRDEIEAMLGLLSNNKTWVKLCGYRSSDNPYPHDDVQPLARTLVNAAPDRCLWGTDWPHPGLGSGMPDDAALLDLLSDWTPNLAIRDQILVDNPARLYGFNSD
ncbi:amidohydrolase [Cupriavidus sp. D384]|uniref:amidohydrolase family protein n=1 Tax=Cupriavidus sp. D384 TaxID=1538095 RepID=UPI00082BC817|nr:amidohydrolase family protein [Cupriavidus sp. D384]